MTDTNQLPPSDSTGTQAMWPQMILALAEIDRALGLPDDGCNSLEQTLSAIRALQSRAQLAQGEPVSDFLTAFDGAVSQALPRVSHVEYDSHEICKHFAGQLRAILALRPVQVPMTDEHLSVLKEMADRCPELNLSNYDSDDVDELNSWAVEIAVYIDGITAQSKKEQA